VNPGTPVKVEKQPTTFPGYKASVATRLAGESTPPAGSTGAPDRTQATGGGRPGPKPGAGFGVNKDSGGAASTVGWGSARVGKRFRISFTPDGRIVHTYGKDVPAAERRQVLPRKPRAARA
jgi:hypothetical protein